MKKSLSIVLASLFTSTFVFADTAPKTISKIPSNAIVSYVNDTRSGGKLEIVEYTESSTFKFKYPRVCEVGWAAAEGVYKSTVSLRCPKTAGFAKFEWWYGSGVTATLGGDQIKDDLHDTYPADNNWHTIEVKRAPHEGSSTWTNVNIVPLF